MRRLATWVIEPTVDAAVHVTRKIKAGETRAFAVQGSSMNADMAVESVAVDMLMSDLGEADVWQWEPVVVQGQAMVMGANYNNHAFVGPITLRFRKTSTAMPVGVSDFES